ncbi:hypothetical protein [Ralstonia pseudosolanacearum]|uniref:hypothetical protein n=1 Tax=Ralstonia pseudosolanacearum TaxID=1310165 RepID=UPI0011C3AB55
MILAIPTDFPGHSFSDQLRFIAEWARIPVAPLLSMQTEIAAALGSRRTCVAALKQALPSQLWDWPEYQAFIEGALADEDEQDADSIRLFDSGERDDMVCHVFDKLRSRQQALHRQTQVRDIAYLHPFWQLSHGCEPKQHRLRTFLATDPVWNGRDAPWNCRRLACHCRIYTLTRTEMQRYVDAGCAPGDEAAANLFRALTAKEGDNT